MKPTEIIYWNQYSGLTEPCQKSEMHNARDVTIYNAQYKVDYLAQSIFIDGEYLFTIKSRDLGQFASPTEYRLHVSGKPKMVDSPIVMSCKINLVEKTDDYLDFQLTEQIGTNNNPVKIGMIKLLRHLTEKINGYSGKAAIIIHDVTMNKGTHQTLLALGQLAMSLGLYVFAILDGEWERVWKDYNDDYKNPDRQRKPLTQQLADKSNELFELKMRFDELQKESEKQIRQLQQKIREQTGQIALLREQNAQLISINQQLDKPLAEIPKTPKINYLDELKRQISGEKLCVVGGSQKWQAKFALEFDDVTLIDNKNFDEQKLKNADLVVINTNFIGHDCTNKAVALANQAGIKIVYTGKNNLNNFAKEVLSNLI